MIITIVCDVLGSENNGTTIAEQNLIRALKERGHTVRVVCGDEDKRGEDGYFVVKNFNLGKKLNGYLEKNGVKIAKNDKKLLESAIKDADAVHVTLPFFLGTYARKMAIKYKKPLTASFHCQAENITSHLGLKNFQPLNKMVYKILNKNLYKYCDVVHYPTQFICEVFEREVKNAPPHKIISNGVKKIFTKKVVEKPAELKDKFIILFSGRFSKEKCHNLLIDAVNNSKYKNDIQLIFCGKGPIESKVKEYGESLLENKPIIKFVSASELCDIINYSDLYVHPADIEIEAISCLEAISCGLVPVINNSPKSATKFFALTDMNLFDFNNSNDLTKKIEYWYEHPFEKAEMSKKYQGYAKEFDFDYCMNKMEEMLVENYNQKTKKK